MVVHQIRSGERQVVRTQMNEPYQCQHPNHYDVDIGDGKESKDAANLEISQRYSPVFGLLPQQESCDQEPRDDKEGEYADIRDTSQQHESFGNVHSVSHVSDEHHEDGNSPQTIERRNSLSD